MGIRIYKPGGSSVELDAHIADVGNPHEVTKTQVGLGNVDNVQQLAKTSNLSDVSNAATSFSNIKQSASDSVTGVVELSTDAEIITGTDTARAVTPANITAKLANPGEMGLTTPFKIHGRLNTKTVSTTPVTLTTAEVANGIIFVTTGASVINLPAGSSDLDGAPCTFVAIAAVVFSVDPNGTEVMVLNGTALTGGNKITTDGIIDTRFTIVWDNTNARWRVLGSSGVLIDGGA